MHESLLICLALIFSAFILVLIARRLSVPYPIFLVMAGLFISFVPSVPKIQIDPYIVFLIILPLFYLILFLVGLQLPCVTAGIPNIISATVIALLITIIVIVTRSAAGYISSLFRAFISR